MSSDAIAEGGSLLRLDWEQAEACLATGYALSYRGDEHAAFSYFRKAADLVPGWAKPHLGLALTSIWMGKVREAMAEYLQAWRADPDQREWYEALQQGASIVEIKLGNGLSGADLEESLRQEAECAEKHLVLACFFERILGDQDATTEYREALRMSPGLFRPRLGLGRLLTKSGDAKGAVGQLRDAVRLRPNDRVAHESSADALRSVDSIEAILEYRQAIRAGAAGFWVHWHLATLLKESGDTRGAVVEYLTALRLRASRGQHVSKVVRSMADPDYGIHECRELLRRREGRAVLGRTFRYGRFDRFCSASQEIKPDYGYIFILRQRDFRLNRPDGNGHRLAVEITDGNRSTN